MATKQTSLFDKMRNGMTAMDRTTASKKWFQEKVKSLQGKSINALQMLKDPHFIRKNQFKPGFMYHFLYDPKFKDTLPYYDRFPLMIAVGPAPGGFYGLNLHYLAPVPRARLLDRLIETTNNDAFDETTKMKINYKILNSLSSMRFFRPCFKHYLFDHVESRMMMVPASEWEIAMFLPTEKFQGASKRQVWKESKQLVTGYRP